MPESDPRAYLLARLSINRLKTAQHPIARTVFELGSYGMVKFGSRKWNEVPESSKLAMLKDLVCWEGVTDRDMAMLLLHELDVGKLTQAERGWLISTAEPDPLRRQREGSRQRTEGVETQMDRGGRDR
jgi:hypothetical protein